MAWVEKAESDVDIVDSGRTQCEINLIERSETFQMFKNTLSAPDAPGSVSLWLYKNDKKSKFYTCSCDNVNLCRIMKPNMIQYTCLGTRKSRAMDEPI